LASQVQKAWMGQAGHIPWPLRSQDLTPCNFYLWGYVKNQVYQPPMPQSLWEKISQAKANINESQSQCAREEVEYRIDVCRVTNEAHQTSLDLQDVLKWFHVCICNCFKNTLISYEPYFWYGSVTESSIEQPQWERNYSHTC
jgi:hypothetical protein